MFLLLQDIQYTDISVMGILVCHINKKKNFLENRLVFSININVYCLYINILWKQNLISG